MFCENCGSELPEGATFCGQCGFRVKPVGIVKENKNMLLALIISFFLPGLGIVYAGNVKNGILLFAASLIFSLLGFGIPICIIIGLAIWVCSLYMTYNEVQIANGIQNPNLIEDFKTWPSSKRVAGGIVLILILFLLIGGVIGAFSNNSTHHSDYSSLDDTHSSSSPSSSSPSSSSPSSSSSSGSSKNSYSSSSNGHDVESHYEGDYGSADTHGTVYDDGSVESHQTGHTNYGDYQVDSYMDSNGHIRGTVNVGGHTYHVNK